MGVAARRQREKEERRAAILGAAEKVFASKGVAPATMDDIAHEAELSKGTLYLYFDSKDELYLEIAVRAVREVLDQLQAAEAAGGAGFTRLARALRGFARFGLEQPDRFHVAIGWMITEAGGTVQSERFVEYKRLVAQFYRQLATLIDAGKRDGTIRPELDTPTLVAQLWGSMLGVLLLQLNAPVISTRMPAEMQVGDIVTPGIDLLLSSVGTGAASLARDHQASPVGVLPPPEVA